MVDRRIRRENLRDIAAGEIRERIFSGQLTPGDRVNQDQLAEELGISKLPIREALITLDNEGLVRITPRRGARVAPLTREDVLDHFHVFGIVSGIAAERAARNLTDEQLAELKELVEQMEAATRHEEQEELNERFHRLINVAGGSRRLAAVLRLLAQSLPARFFESHAEWPDMAQQDHRLILEALRNRDKDTAQKALSEHLRKSGEHVVRYLESRGFWDDAEKEPSRPAD